MKKKIIGSCLLLIIFVLITGTCFANSVNVSVNGEQLQFEVAPVIEDGRTLVPLRIIFEKLGAEITWDSETKKITATKGNDVVVLQIGSDVATVNTEELKLDVPAKILNGSTMVPVRFVSEAMNSVVDWDATTQTVVIRSAKVMSRTIENEQTWSKAEGPYILKSNFQLKSKGKLTIEAGTEVYMMTSPLSFQGELILNGTEQAPISFKNRSGSEGVIYLRHSNNQLNYLITDCSLYFEKANDSSVKNSTCSMIEVDNSNGMTISNNELEGMIYGIRVFSSDGLIIQNNSIKNAEKGIVFKTSKNVELSKNEISSCAYGIYSNSNYNSKIYENQIREASTCALLIEKGSTGNEYYYNNFYDNEINAKVDIGEKFISLKDNYWGTYKEEEIQEKILDFSDNVNFTKVDYMPFLKEPYQK